jgi:hypothetical protein
MSMAVLLYPDRSDNQIDAEEEPQRINDPNKNGRIHCIAIAKPLTVNRER